jgi:hypothetical protein
LRKLGVGRGNVVDLVEVNAPTKGKVRLAGVAIDAVDRSLRHAADKPVGKTVLESTFATVLSSIVHHTDHFIS